MNISYETVDLEAEAKKLANCFGFEVCTTLEEHFPQLHLTSSGLFLHTIDMKPWQIDFLTGIKNYRRKHGGSETLAKACGVKKNSTAPITVLDLTAGLAKDAFVLACLGAHVILVEREPIMAALLDDALKRFYNDVDASKNIQLMLYFEEAEVFLKTKLENVIPELPDVIYIDPMHPARQKSAHVKKDMQILQQWIPPEAHPELLLDLSLRYAKKRVVLKWPRKSPAISSLHKPAYMYEENTVRFEVYKP
jgi:16S rRNA (guanine1516-N2)-methyltransferase